MKENNTSRIFKKTKNRLTIINMSAVVLVLVLFSVIALMAYNSRLYLSMRSVKVMEIKSPGGEQAPDKLQALVKLREIGLYTDDVKSYSLRIYEVIGFTFILLLLISFKLSRYLTRNALKPIKSSYEKQVFFVQDASHEMRTPIAVIKGKAELLLNSNLSDDNLEKVSEILSEIRNMEKTYKDLLTLSKEDVDSSLDPQNFGLSIFTSELDDFFQLLSKAQNKKFFICIPEAPLIVRWDYSKMKQSLTILLDNAFKYTLENGEIKLIFEETKKNLLITISDTGIGIKEKDQNRVFDRFFRSDEVRSRNIDGSGIGLSILMSLSRDMGFKIKLLSKENKGTTFLLTVPKNM